MLDSVCRMSFVMPQHGDVAAGPALCAQTGTKTTPNNTNQNRNRKPPRNRHEHRPGNTNEIRIKFRPQV